MVLFEALFNVVVLVDYGLVELVAVEFVVVFPVVVFVYIIEFVVV